MAFFVLDFLAFSKILESSAFDRRTVEKQFAALTLDEAESLLRDDSENSQALTHVPKRSVLKTESKN